MERTTLLLLTGGRGESEVVRDLEAARRAAARDLLETLSQIPGIERTIVATNHAGWASTLDDLPVEVDLDPPGEPFHFGRRLAGLIQRCGAQRVLYTSGGSAPLLRRQQWVDVLESLGRGERVVISNNLHSCDWAGFVPAQEACSRIAEQVNDNSIAWTLAHELGFRAVDRDPSAGSRFDIDTPMDLLIAHRHPRIASHLRRYLDGLGWRSPQLDGVLAEMAREGGRLMVAGRVSAAAWVALERSTRCWVRVYAEERGMRASGRQGRGEVRSLLADYANLVSVEHLFDRLSELAHAILLDNRVILASRSRGCAARPWPSATDRFHSDLQRWRDVKDPFLQRLTRAAAEASVPVVMGGHSVVTGGLMALTEVLQTRRSVGQEENVRWRRY